jgi:hypothetical protein
MTDKNEDENPTAGEQFAFSEARDLALRCIAEGYPALDVGRGIFIAALVAFRKALPDTEISKILYEYADDYAVRHLPPDDH